MAASKPQAYPAFPRDGYNDPSLIDEERVMWTWPGIALGIGAALVIFEWWIARKKKEGITWTDKRRMVGIVQVSVGLALFAMFLAWIAE